MPEALHCSGCGRELGLEPLANDGALGCPVCAAPLTSVDSGPGSVHDCQTCGGQFVEHALLRELLEERLVYRAPLSLRATRMNPLDQPLHYVRCPSCRELMNRRNFGKTSGIIVDECHRHGIWFDAGELPRILAFVQAGGLAESQRQDLTEKSRHEALRRDLGSLANDGASSFDSAHISGEPSLVGELRDASAALLEHVKAKLFHR
jgi:Zn-finger nucleic acid-binding protein